jgi:predicted metal-dependent phosphoesterase TrpH
LECSGNLRIIDLHVHSNASDGSLSPRELALRAQGLGLAAFAITDHDTLDGVRALQDAGLPAGLHFLPGIEISASAHQDFPCFGSMHILGYGIRSSCPELQAQLDRLQAARRCRTPQILARLNALGIAMTMEEVCAICEEGQVGRPHIAQALVRKGVVADIDQAFERLLGTGKPAYVDKYRIPCQKALDIIREAGGLAVLAHPALIKPQGSWQLKDLVARLSTEGLQGLEVFYPGHSPAQTRIFQQLAQRYGLLVSGGSDFHGEVTPGIEMGLGRGDLCVPFEIFERLTEALASNRSPGNAESL